MDKSSALDALEARLRLLKDHFEAVAKDGPVPDWRIRGAAAHSVNFLVEFINAVPAWRGLDFGLTPLLVALDNIEHGRDVEWLKPLRGSGKPPVSDEVAAVRGYCAGVMELLMKTKGRRKAAEFVHRCIPVQAHSRLVDRGDKFKASTIAGWRDGVTGADAMRERERQSYTSALGFAQRRPINDQIAKMMVRSAVKLALGVTS